MKPMRRQDRKLTEEEALQILDEAECGILSTITPDGLPYGLPINYAREGRQLFMHCTSAGGQKLDNISHCANACMTAVTGVQLNSEALTTSFRSAMAFGKVTMVTDPDEKRQGLRVLLKRLAPMYVGHDPQCMDDMPLERCLVLRMDIDTVSGKFHL